MQGRIRQRIPSSNTTSWRFGSSSMESWVLRELYDRLFLKLFFRGSQVLCLWARLYGRQRSVCQCLCECCAETHLSSVAHADVSAHRLESTGSTGQEVGAVVGLQEANKVGALRLRDTETWTFVKASSLKEVRQKIHFICFPPHLYTIKVHNYLRYTLPNPSFAIPKNTQKQISATDEKRSDKLRGSVNRDMSVVNRGPQEAQGRLLPFSCMQEKQLIIRVV